MDGPRQIDQSQSAFPFGADCSQGASWNGFILATFGIIFSVGGELGAGSPEVLWGWGIMVEGRQSAVSQQTFGMTDISAKKNTIVQMAIETHLLRVCSRGLNNS